MRRGGKTPTEFQQRHARHLEGRDVPKDPRDPAHFKAVSNGHSRLLGIVNTSHDGKVGLEDLEGLLKDEVAVQGAAGEVDHNHDGVISSLEVDRLMMQRDAETAALHLTVDLLKAKLRSVDSFSQSEAGSSLLQTAVNQSLRIYMRQQWVNEKELEMMEALKTQAGVNRRARQRVNVCSLAR